MKLHGNARLTPRGRRLLVARVCEQRCSLESAALLAADGMSERLAAERRRDDDLVRRVERRRRR